MADTKGADQSPGKDVDSFAQQAEEAAPGILRELWGFIRYNKKWWLTPIILALLLVGVFVILSSSAAAPFIYTLF